MKKIVFAIMLTFVSGVLYAGHPLISDDAYTQGKNHFQLELTGEYDYYKNNEDDTKTNLHLLQPVVHYGLLENADLGLAPVFAYAKTTRPQNAIERRAEMELHIKWNFFNVADTLSFAFKPGVAAPMDDKYSASFSENLAYSAYFIISYAYKRLGLHANSGYVAAAEAGHYSHIWHNSLAGEYNFYGPFKAVANLGIDFVDTTKSGQAYFVLGGLCYSPTPAWDFDIGFKRIFSDGPAFDYAILAGLTYRI